ncbi:MAG: NAD-dependent epimerase/dehydratase family protein [Gammaproteobacteria bacterium]
MRVAITGASGFVGGALCARLAAEGHRIVAFARHATDDLRRFGQVFCLDERSSAAEFQTALAGCHAVVHLAARTHQGERVDPQSRAAFAGTNVDLSRMIVEQGLRAGVDRFVYLSSSKVMGEYSPRIAPDAWQSFSGASPAAPLGLYAVTKYAAERLFSEAVATAAKRLTILRPPLIYGPGLKGNLLTLLRAIWRGVPLPLAAIVNRRSLVHRDHLLEAIRLALNDPRPGIWTYTLADCAYSTPDLVSVMAGGLGCRARLWRCPVAVLRPIGYCIGARAQISRLTESLLLDASEIERELGWRPQFEPTRAWAEIGHWFRQTPKT